MSDFGDSFSRDCRNPAVENCDNEGLATLRAGSFAIGYVDEVNGGGGEEMAFIPTRHELLQLVKYWTEKAFNIEFDWFLYQQYGSSDLRKHHFAWRRVARIESAIGEAAVTRAVDEIADDLARKGEGWRIFLRGTDEERDAFHKDAERAMCEPPNEER
jgi:hypothetical protein